MAVIVFDDFIARGADMSETGLYPGLFENAATSVTAFGFDITRTIDGKSVKVSVFGEGLTYTMSGDVITGITGGTISGISQFTNDKSEYGIGSLAYVAADFHAAVVAQDRTTLLALLTGGDDVILGNYARAGDVLLGREGDDSINGNGGMDTLSGGTGSDTLRGDNGDDRLSGGKGHDLLAGGQDSDSFVFSDKGNKHSDAIRGFNGDVDGLELSAAAFRQLGPVGTLAESAFQTGTVALDADDRIIFDSVTGKLWYDSNGSAAAGMSLIARLEDAVGFDYTDILVF